ncbi:MAG: SEL1-like repeat protein [Oscillospiraceae bacterium]|nr:SEL1-like repeat protein [Oscillospiraceae bacterium]
MPRIILKSPYLKPNRKKHLGNYVKYIATRDGAEPAENPKRYLSAADNQKQLIQKLLKAYPDCQDLHEHQDYLRQPTKGNADELIQRISEIHFELLGDREKYVSYIAERPRVEKLGSHGLFTDEGVPFSLEGVAQQVAESESNVWTHIISLRREDAARLGYDSAEAWMQLLRSQRNMIAENMKIAPENFRWYAAFHNESHHPHVHMIAYSVDPKEAYLSTVGIERIKSSIAREIFQQDLISVYERQTGYRDDLRTQGKDVVAEIIADINHGVYDNPVVEELLLRLAERLANTTGKKVYGYLKADAKRIVDSVVAELAKDPRIEKLYDLWYQQREEVLRTYTDTMPERIPLAENKEFKSIKNAVIQESLNLIGQRFPVEDPPEPEDTILNEPEPQEEEEISFTTIPISASYFSRQEKPQQIPLDETLPTEKPLPPPKNVRAAVDFDSYAFKLYRAAKELLNRDSEEYDPEKAIALLAASAEQGLSLAQYRLGKLLLQGTETEPSMEDGLYWLEQAAAQENEWAQYLLGKTLLQGILVAQDSDRGKELLEASYQQDNRYAAYALGKAYLDGILLPQDIPAALERLRFSAEQGFTPSQYVFGKLLYRGELLPQDIPGALALLEAAAEDGNPYAAALAAKIYLTEEICKSSPNAIRLFKLAAENGSDYAEYQLGKLYLLGSETEQNIPEALYWLGQAADHGNQYAAQLLHSYHSGHVWGCSLGALRLLQQLARAFEDREQEQNRNIRQMKAERKLLQKIEEKRQAHGLKHG